MAVLLAGCGRAVRRATVAPSPTATTAPTATPTQIATPTHTRAPTETPTPSRTAQRSMVVRTHHPGVWDGQNLDPAALREMLDVSITTLMGLDGPAEAWAALFSPDERIGIKVNTIYPNSFQWTHIPLVATVTERLQEVGIPAERIVVFDRLARELERAGYPTNEDRPGVRCYGTDSCYTPGWTIMDTDISLSDILLNCDALINMPILKHHEYSGVTFAMKNHFGNINRPSSFHGARTAPGIAQLNALGPIKDRTRVIIGDTLEICPWSATKGGWHQTVTRNSILVSFDPVAHDAVGLEMLVETMASAGHNVAGAVDLATPWLASSAELGLGTNDLANIDLVDARAG
jgi:hypothetical protein